MERRKPILKIGNTYHLKIYPYDDDFKGSYIASDGKRHIFSGEYNGVRGYALVSDHWINELPDGTITHLPISSFGVLFVPEDKVESLRKSMPEFLDALSRSNLEAKV